MLDILFPPLCAICEKTISDEKKFVGICDACALTLPLKTALTCPVCRARLAEGKKTCHKDAPFLLSAASSYDNEKIKRLVWQLKYEKRTYAARPLAHIMLLHASTTGIFHNTSVLVPIPLHSSRERERGFNQAEEIGKIIATARNMTFAPHGLIRVKKTTPQAETNNREERTANLLGAFRANAELVSGKNICLIDDVCTSGATLTEAARALKRAGAKRVTALVAAVT